MIKRITTTGLLLGLLALAACDKNLPDPALPRADATRPATPSSPDPSVPSATVVLAAPATATSKDEPAARVAGTLSPAQESSAMPMPGQVNNHSSTALDAAKSASAP